VAYVADTSSYGGAEVYLQHLFRHSAGRAQPSLFVAFPGASALEGAARDLAVPVKSFARIGSKRDLGEVYRLGRAMVRSGSQIVHVNMATATNNRHAIAAAWVARLPAIATVHAPIAVGPARHTIVLRWLFSRLCAVIVVSSGVREIVIDDLHVPPGRVHFIRNGVGATDPVFAASGRSVRIVAAGRLEAEKGFDVLVAAIRLLVERGIAIDVSICGEGGRRSALEDAARGLPVTFRGFVADPARLWQDTDIFCLPSRVEGLPMALLEAMMRGLPCVATDVGDVADALGAAGIVVPPDDPVALAAARGQLAADPARRKTLGDTARARTRATYSAETMVERTLSLYEACARGSLPVRPPCSD
jgi:glycosyltransferase involved in cell wall biosynthesis